MATPPKKVAHEIKYTLMTMFAKMQIPYIVNTISTYRHND